MATLAGNLQDDAELLRSPRGVYLQLVFRLLPTVGSQEVHGGQNEGVDMGCRQDPLKVCGIGEISQDNIELAAPQRFL